MINPDGIKNIINNDSWIEAIAQLRQMHVDLICNSEDDETKIREVAYMRIKTIDQIISHLSSIADGETIDNARWKI
jgi:hypothetical protein